MKQISLLLIAFSLAGAGLAVSSRLAQRVASLKNISLFLSAVSTEIEFSLLSAAEIFEKLSGVYSRELPFAAECASRLMNGESFDRAWSDSLAAAKSASALKKEDILLLESFGKAFGTTDMNGQITNCEMHIRLIESNLQKAENELKTYRRPAAAIGVLSGAAVYILLM